MKSDKLLEIIKGKSVTIPYSLFKKYKELSITEKELIFIAFVMETDKLFDPETLSQNLNWNMTEILEVISSLSEKNYLNITVKTQDKQMKEYIDLDNLFEIILLDIIDEKEEIVEKEPSKIYNIIEAELGRTLSPIENETIREWLNSNISEELIKEALKEAVLNGVSNLKYIDKILFEWTKKGYKKASDVRKKKRKEEKREDLFEYNWLDENV